MAKVYYSELAPFRIATNLQKLRESKQYQVIRDEVNRRFNPLAGSTDWVRVYHACEELAMTDGVDLLVAIYYSAAALKTVGLSGFAKGLELQAAVLSDSSQDNGLTANRRVELYNWLNGRVLADIRHLNPSRDQLRDLYRCERALEAINSCLLALQPQQMPELESLGLSLFEHIDRLEIPLKEVIEKRVEKIVKVRKYSIVLATVFGLLVGIGAVFLYDWLEIRIKQPLNQLTQVNITPLAFEPYQLRQLINRYSEVQRQQIKPEVLQVYDNRVEQILNQPIGQQLADVQNLINQLGIIYPDDSHTLLLQHKFDLWSARREELFQAQQNRFVNMRTASANLQRYIARSDWNNAVRTAKNLEGYAIGLSPMLGRLSYIEELIDKNDLIQAERELEILELLMQGVAVKKVALQRLIAQKQQNR